MPFTAVATESGDRGQVRLLILDSDGPEDGLNDYRKYLEIEIRCHWIRVPDAPPSTVRITFRIHAGGELSDLRLALSSSKADESALRGTPRRGPFAKMDQAALKSIGHTSVYEKAPPPGTKRINFLAIFQN